MIVVSPSVFADDGTFRSYNIKLDDNTISATNDSGLYLYDNASNGIFVEDGGDVGIGDTSPAALFTVGDGDKFQVDASGNTTIDNQGDVRLVEADVNGANYTGFQAPAALASDVLYTLPTTDGSSGQVLSTNGSSTLGWSTGGLWTDQTTYIEPSTIGANEFRIYDSGGLNVGGDVDPGSSNLALDNQGDLRLYEGDINGANYTGFQAPAALASDLLYTLPTTDGAVGQALTTNGSTVLSWAGAAGLWTDQTTYIEPNTIGANEFRIYDSGGLNIGGTTDPGSGMLSLANDLIVGAGALDDDDYIYFDDGSTEYLKWADAEDLFSFSDDLEINGTGTSTITNDTGDIVIDPAGNLIVSNADVGIGTNSPNEILTVEGVLSLAETAAAITPTAGYGKIYTKSADSKLYFMDDSGNELELGAGYWTKIGNDIYYDLGNVGIGTTTPLAKLAIDGGLHVGGDSDPGDNNIVADGNITAGGYLKTQTGGAYNQGALYFSYQTLNSKDDDWLYLGDETAAVYGGQGFAAAHFLTGDGAININSSIYDNDSDLTLDDNVIVSGDLSVNGNTTLGSDSADTITFNAKAASALDMNSNNITNVNKLTANEIDPVYNIDGEKYATWAAFMTGLKEETVGKVKLSLMSNVKCQMSKPNVKCQNLDDKIYGYEIDFGNQEKGSDLWLFEKITAWGEDWQDLMVNISPEGKADVWYELKPWENKLVIYGTRPVTVTYRLTAPRSDWPERDTNLAQDADDIAGLHFGPSGNLDNNDPPSSSLDDPENNPSFVDETGSAGNDPISNIQYLISNLTVDSNLNMQGYAITNIGGLAGKDNKWMIDENGNFITQGLIAQVIDTSEGQKTMYAMASPQPEYTISGHGELIGGGALIKFEDWFHDVISSDVELKVVVTPTSECQGIYVASKVPLGFIVRELAGGTSNAQFDWIAIARKKGYENVEDVWSVDGDGWHIVDNDQCPNPNDQSNPNPEVQASPDNGASDQMTNDQNEQTDESGNKEVDETNNDQSTSEDTNPDNTDQSQDNTEAASDTGNTNEQTTSDSDSTQEQEQGDSNKETPDSGAVQTDQTEEENGGEDATSSQSSGDDQTSSDTQSSSDSSASEEGTGSE